MSIAASEIKFYKAQNNTDLDGNGGVISTTRVNSNVLNNLFPNVTNTERVAGLTRYRKFFMRNENNADLTLQSAAIWISELSDGQDYFRLHIGTDTDVQSAADDYTNWYGSGLLAQSVGSGESQLVVDYDAADGVFSGEEIWLRLDDTSGEVDVRVQGTPSWVGSQATINISGEVGRNFTQTVTVVSTKLSLSDIEATSNSWVETSSSGTYDESSYPVVLYNVGTVTDSWTITFTDATNFTCSGASTGSVGSGSTASDFQPVNGASYYFKIDKDGWGGTWANGDTVTFNTVHAGKAVWVKEIVPAAASTQVNNSVELEWEGESA